MKRVLILLALVASLLGTVGCHRDRHMVRRGCGNAYCDRCGGGGAGTRVPRLPHGYAEQTGPAGTMTGQYAYPYYTTRGPRDFLVNEPSSIGN